MKTTLEILREARELISVPERWTAGWFARDRYGVSCDAKSDRASCWCASGALRRVTPAGQNFEPALMALRRFTNGEPVTTVNDGGGHQSILRVFDAAIADEEARQ